MSTFEVMTRISHRWLMQKSKSELASIIMRNIDVIDILTSETDLSDVPEQLIAPLPWRVSGFEIGTGGATRVLMAADHFFIGHICGRTPEENAANAHFIVLACNALIEKAARPHDHR